MRIEQSHVWKRTRHGGLQSLLCISLLIFGMSSLSAVEDCSDGIDNDGDNLIDCYDYDCIGGPCCPEVELDCFDGLDGDGDGDVDCYDSDCSLCPCCSVSEECRVLPNGTLDSSLCEDGIDNDCDGIVDGDEALCPCSALPEDCDNGIDDDADSLADCADPDCANAANCQESGNCSDQIDNDLDMLIDCDDPDCAGDLACLPAETCDNGQDDDGDTLSDCDDPDCAQDPNCTIPLCVISEPAPCSGLGFRCGSQQMAFNPITGMHGAFSLPLTVEMDSPNPTVISGGTILLEAEVSELSLLGIVEGVALEGLDGGMGPEFFEVQTCDGSTPTRAAISLGFVTDFQLEELVTLTGAPLEIARLEVAGVGLQGTSSERSSAITWIETGTCQPMISNVLTDSLGNEIDPSCKIDGTVCFFPTSQVAFLRGDIDENATVSLGDPIALLHLLFGVSTLETECEAACDVNGDSHLGLGDPIYLLAFLFAGGAEPVGPFGQCGLSPFSQDLDCLHFNACP